MGNMKKTDYRKLDALVSKAIKGDRKAFEKLCETEAPAIIYACTKQMGNKQDGEDAAQEVFVRLQRYLHTLSAPEAFVVWLQKIIRDVCIKMRRGSMNQITSVPIEEYYGELVEADRGVIPEAYIHDQERRQELSIIIDSLPEKKRECVLLHYFNGLKIIEIADVMGITEGAVKAHLYGARNKIKNALELREEAVSPITSAWLPMAALEQLFRQELVETVTPSMVHHCLKGAGFAISPLKWVPLAASVKGVAAATVACTVVAATGVIGWQIVASTWQPVASLSEGVPQHQVSEATVSGSEDIASVQSDAASVASLPSSLSNGRGKAASEGRLPLGVPAPQGAVATRVQGKLMVKNSQGEKIARLLPNQYYAMVEQNGRQLAFVMVKEDGSFTFDNLAIQKDGSYMLCIQSVHNYGFVFSSGGASETKEIQLVPGQAFVLEEPFILLDQAVPMIAVSLLTENRENTAINPAIIEIDVYDATETALYWEIRAEGNEVAVLNGNTKKITGATLRDLPPGTYTLGVQASDALGNKTTLDKLFYMSTK